MQLLYTNVRGEEIEDIKNKIKEKGRKQTPEPMASLASLASVASVDTLELLLASNDSSFARLLKKYSFTTEELELIQYLTVKEQTPQKWAVLNEQVSWIDQWTDNHAAAYLVGETHLPSIRAICEKLVRRQYLNLSTFVTRAWVLADKLNKVELVAYYEKFWTRYTAQWLGDKWENLLVAAAHENHVPMFNSTLLQYRAKDRVERLKRAIRANDIRMITLILLSQQMSPFELNQIYQDPENQNLSLEIKFSLLHGGVNVDTPAQLLIRSFESVKEAARLRQVVETLVNLQDLNEFMILNRDQAQQDQIIGHLVDLHGSWSLLRTCADQHYPCLLVALRRSISHPA